MYILMRRGAILRGVGHVDAGTKHEVDERDAIALIASGKAMKYTPEPEAPKKPTTRRRPLSTKTAGSLVRGKK